MARLVFDGNYSVHWLDTAPADSAAPTTTEITAGTDITAFIPKDGFSSGTSNNRVAGGDLSTAFDAESMGTWGSQLSVRAYLDDTSNIAFDTFGEHGTTGAFVVIWDGGGNAATSKAYVWPDVEAGAPVFPGTAANERQSFTAEFAVRAEPVFDAVVAAAA